MLFSVVRTKYFLLRSETRQGCLHSSLLFSIVLILAMATEKKNLRNPDRKRSKAITACR